MHSWVSPYFTKDHDSELSCNSAHTQGRNNVRVCHSEGDTSHPLLVTSLMASLFYPFLPLTLYLTYGRGGYCQGGVQFSSVIIWGGKVLITPHFSETPGAPPPPPPDIIKNQSLNNCVFLVICALFPKCKFSPRFLVYPTLHMLAKTTGYSLVSANMFNFFSIFINCLLIK